MSAYAEAMDRKIQNLNEMDAVYADMLHEALDLEDYVGSRRWLYVRACDGAMCITSGDMPDDFWWRCVAAGSKAACEAAARLLSS